ncbi:MAG: hypothetical protein A3J40_11820 [Erythrobacter sp. RIFCSPHIGHO2_12_FULL_63_10]|nr:MAG: hypothetical protein A3J40_11820 [Erythrobacter sp. RIFCSPHIGHO2_12_FULL_63_10]
MNGAAATPFRVQRAFERARAAHEAQDLETAWEVAGRAVALAPEYPAAAFLKAQIAFESWRPSVALFEQALALDQANPVLVRNFILALSAEKQEQRADALLSGILARNRNWLEGHALLSTLRLTCGESEPFRSYAEAAQASPQDSSLRLAWFHRLATARQWDAAEAVLEALEQDYANVAGVHAARLFLDCETDRAPTGREIFAALANLADPGLALTEVRHALRKGDPGHADRVTARWIQTPHAPQFWPYRDLAWRLLDDPRHGWLGGDPAFASTDDLDVEPSQLAELADFLRSLHQMQAPYPEQSVRGGTQTPRNLLLHHDPRITRIRAKLATAVTQWRDGLPSGDGGHPLLDRKPTKIRFAGSWSVRLLANGHHSPHVHPQGWASSAFYVALPQDLGNGEAGRFVLGMPPVELGLPLEPERLIDPAPGRLALFPSTSWHGTLPFSGEERLTLAFDIAPGLAKGDHPQ